MTSSINQTPWTTPPILCDFGWVYGDSNLRLPEASYTVGTTAYPPGKTTLGTNVTLPTTPITSGFSSLDDLKAAFPAEGQFVIVGPSSHAVVNYTSLVTIGGGYGFGGCTTSATGTFSSGDVLYDPRDYVDSLPLHSVITFDAVDYYAQGNPKTVAPPGVTVLAYEWSFGNGQIGNGPIATTTYTYNQPPASVQATLTAVDSLGRRASCAHHLNLLDLAPVWAAVNHVNPL
jgi:hypothetical protein